MTFLIPFFLITFFVCIFPVSAKNETKSDSPLNVTSDSMLAKKIASTIEFKGNVVVTRDDYIIHADSITMFFTKKTKTNAKEKNKIDKIIATGNVKFISGKRKAYAGRAVYTYKNEVLVLTENNPKVITDGNSVTGEKITVFQRDDRITIEGGVNAVFIPDNENKTE